MWDTGSLRGRGGRARRGEEDSRRGREAPTWQARARAPSPQWPGYVCRYWRRSKEQNNSPKKRKTQVSTTATVLPNFHPIFPSDPRSSSLSVPQPTLASYSSLTTTTIMMVMPANLFLQFPNLGVV